MNLRFTYRVMIFLFAAGTWVRAQDIDITRLPGYMDLEKIKIPKKAGKVTDIDLGPALLKMLSWGQEEGIQVADGLAGILNIRVKSFDIDSTETKTIASQMEKFESTLRKENWERLVQIRNEEQKTNISMKMKEGKIVGFFLMSMETGRQVSFANIVGANIDLNKIKDVGLGMSQTGVDSLWKNLHSIEKDEIGEKE